MENSKSNSDFMNGLTPDIMEGYLKGTLSAEMRQKVDQYLKENPFEAEAMDGFKSYSVDLNRELNDLNEKLSANILSPTKKSSGYFWQVAAVITLVVVSGLIIYLLLPGQQESTPIAVNQDISSIKDEGRTDQVETEAAPLPKNQSPDKTTADPEKELKSTPVIDENEIEITPAAPPDEINLEENVNEDISLEQAPSLDNAIAVNGSSKTKKSVAGQGLPAAAARTNQAIESPMAQPPDNWAEYLAGHLNYPEEALTKGIEGTIRIKFQVDQEGNPINLELVNRLGYGCDEEATRVLKDGPLWKPAQLNGIPVLSFTEIEINFPLKKDH